MGVEFYTAYGQMLQKAFHTSYGMFLLTVDPFAQMSLSDLLLIHRTQQSSGADFVNGYRVRSQRPYFRIRIDPLLNQIASYFFKLKMRDYACSVKLFRGDQARSIMIEGRERALVSAEMTLKLHALGAKVSECRIVYNAPNKTIDRRWNSMFRRAQETWRFLSYLNKRIKLFKAGLIQSL